MRASDASRTSDAVKACDAASVEGALEAVRAVEGVKSQGEIEAAVCEGVSRFQQESIVRGPKDIHCHLLGSLVVVRLQGVLTPAERRILDPRGQASGNGHATDGAADSGASEGLGARSLVKQVRDRVVSNGRDRLGRIVEEAVGVRLVSVHHDISTVTGEEVIVFSLDASPTCRPPRRKV